MWLFSFYLLLVASLRFSLVYLCVQFVFSAAVLHFFLQHVNLIWPSCVNCALRGEFPLLHHVLQDIFTYVLFWLIRVNLSLKSQLPYYTINFRFLETNVCWNQISYAMNVPLTFISFFGGAKVTALFLKWKRISLCIVVHRRELIKLFSPPLQFKFNKTLVKFEFKKVKLIFEDVGTLTKIKV